MLIKSKTNTMGILCIVGIFGVVDEAEVKKTQILSKTQMILERTKARLAKEKEGQKAQRQRGGKRSGNPQTFSSTH